MVRLGWQLSQIDIPSVKVKSKADASETQDGRGSGTGLAGHVTALFLLLLLIARHVKRLSLWQLNHISTPRLRFSYPN